MPAATPRIAVVDDDPECCELLRLLLKDQGYEISCFATAGKFFDALIKGRYALAVLDMRLPGMDGREIIRVLRANPETRRMLIIGMSASDTRSADAVAALNLGADEYLAKPMDADFLVARIAALLRRSGDSTSAAPEQFCVDSLKVVPERQEVTVDGKEAILTDLEFRLLVYFLHNANRVLTRQLMLDEVWGVKVPLETRTVDKHVESLRRKLGRFGARFSTVIKVGYVLEI
jgi:DNA-binding response OmpR family regulator